MNSRTKKLTMVAMVCAIAYAVMFVVRIKMFGFLTYDPKDVVITIAGFILGPFSAFVSSVIVGTIEMFTVSDTGVIGLIINILSTASFACIASYIYKKKHTIVGAVIGLLVGSLVMTAVMILWNYLLTPIYMGMPRQAVVDMILPILLPFNLLKCGINSAITMLIYKPIVKALRKTNLIEKSKENLTSKASSRAIIIISLILLATCVLFVLQLNGII